MTEARTPAAEECAHCGREFKPSKVGHRFCSVFCRHRGERKPHERVLVDTAAVERLFDESRDPSERCRDDDWYPASCAAFKHLDAAQTVATTPALVPEPPIREESLTAERALGVRRFCLYAGYSVRQQPISYLADRLARRSQDV